MSDDSGYIQFLAEARSGDRVAMGRLALLVWDRLHPFVWRLTRRYDATEDVLQETLLAMVARLGSLRNTNRFWPWIYRIAWIKVQDRLRDHRLQSALCAEPAANRQRDCYDSPLDAQVRAEARGHVSAAIEQLSRRHRDILHLRCYEQLPYTEIATLTRTTPARARTRFHRAKKSLKNRLTCCV